RSDAGTTGVFDVVGAGSVAYLAYLTDASESTATVRLATINSAGVSVTVADVDDNANVTAVAVAVDDSYAYVAHLWDSGGDLDLHVMSIGGLSVVATETSVRTPTGAERVTLSAIDGVASAFYQFPESAIGSYTPRTVATFTYDADSATAGSDVEFRHSYLASRPFNYDGAVYLHLGHQSTFQSSHFLTRSDGLICGRSNYGLAGAQPTRTRLPSVQQVDGTTFQWAPRVKRRLDVDPADRTLAAYTHDTAVVQTIDFAADLQAVESGGAAYLSSGILWQYDGVSPTEAGFLLFPEHVSVAGSQDSGNLDDSKTYFYRVYWEWTNAAGERERSAAIPFVINAA